MCTVLGWNRRVGELARDVVAQASARGRDGWGFWADGHEYRGLGRIPEGVLAELVRAERVVGNFRATPTTEIETRVDLLQPYGGVVHNGTIANDKELGGGAIDSMVLADLYAGASSVEEVAVATARIKGSYAIAFFKGPTLYTVCNYKPLHYALTPGGGVLFASQPYMLPSRHTIPQPAYSARAWDGVSFTEQALARVQKQSLVLAASAGLDSTTVAYMAKKAGMAVTLAHFRYGALAQRKEVRRIEEIAKHGGFDLRFFDLPRAALAGTIVEGRFNVREQGVSGAEYAHDWVSARNLLMLATLTAFAESRAHGFIGFGGNLEESGAYPDNEEEFANRFNALLPFAVQNGVRIELYHPLTRYMKHEIVAEGVRIGVPFDLTWSCYGADQKHCGRCGPCYMRAKAFERNGLKDPVM